MSDARDKLQAAIAAKKMGGTKKPKRAAKPAPAPAAKTEAPPPISRSSAASAPSKSEKSKSSFLKKKKKPKKSGSKKSGSGGGALGSSFGKLAKNFVDALKEATSEISPGQLVQTAKDGISNLGIGGGKTKLEEDIAADRGSSDTKGQGADTASPAEGSTGVSPPSAAASNGSAAPAQAEEAPNEFSTVKVQKAPPARRKRKPNSTPEAEPVAVEEPVAATEDSADGEPVAGASSAPAEADDAPAPVFPAKVQRAQKKKSKDEPVAAESAESESVGIIPDDEPVSASTSPQEEVDTSAEAEPAPAARESAATDAPAESAGGGAAPEPPKKKGIKKGAKRQPKQTLNVSKEEQLVRAFHSMHTILNSPIWNPIVTDANAKPSSIFAPRQHFDKQWSTPEFRDGLKAASRLASGFTFDPEDIEFDNVAIEAVKNYDFDPQNMIKPHTELITKAIGTSATDEVLELVKKGKVRKLLYSIGTRLGSFVPTIEILARIYIGLRKKEDIIPGDRLQIQEEVLMKYNKSPYTEDMGKKARNLSLDYFTDYLTEYGFKLYKDRMNQAPEGQNHLGAQKRRHSTIKESCGNLVKEWGTKVGISTPAMMNLEGRLMEMSDGYLSELVGETPDDEEAEEA